MCSPPERYADRLRSSKHLDRAVVDLDPGRCAGEAGMRLEVARLLVMTRSDRPGLIVITRSARTALRAAACVGGQSTRRFSSMRRAATIPPPANNRYVVDARTGA